MDTRHRLIEATIDLLESEGLAALSLRTIARRAGMSHGAPLRHFPSYANLLAHVAAEGFLRLTASVDRALARIGRQAPAHRQLATGLRSYARFAAGNPGLLSLMFRWELVDLNEPFLAKASHDAFDRLVDIVKRGQQEGWQRDVDPLLLAGALWCAIQGIVSMWLLGAAQRPTGARRLEQLVDALIRAVLPPQRRAIARKNPPEGT